MVLDERAPVRVRHDGARRPEGAGAAASLRPGGRGGRCCGCGGGVGGGEVDKDFYYGLDSCQDGRGGFVDEGELHRVARADLVLTL